VFVLGSTGAGKSYLALELAQRTSGVIINLDSVQAYEGLKIGSASPTAEDLRRAPHFLYNFIKYPEVTTAGEFRRLALEVIYQEQKNTDFFFVVSGNGFYSRVLEKGTYPIPKADPELQAEYWNELKRPGGEEGLYLKLMKLDPLVAKRFSPHDHYRLVRALEIMRVTGKPLSQIEKEFSESSASGCLPWPILKLGVGAPRTAVDEARLGVEEGLTSQFARSWLRVRLEQRVAKMFEQGFIHEVENLLAQGVSPEWHPLKSVGYSQVVEFLLSSGVPNLEDLNNLKSKVLQAHLKMAKKQRTWFSKEPGIYWLGCEQVDLALARIFKSAAINE
jgi:tRNA dimethylallyltransferase